MLILITLIFAVVAGGTFAIAAELIDIKRKAKEFLEIRPETNNSEWHEDF